MPERPDETRSTRSIQQPQRRKDPTSQRLMAYAVLPLALMMIVLLAITLKLSARQQAATPPAALPLSWQQGHSP